MERKSSQPPMTGRSTQPSGQRFPLNRGTVMGRSIVDGHSVYVPDMRVADPNEYPLGRSLSLELGHRSTMAAPLLSDGSAIGCILLRKPEPDGFTARQMELAETFAAQAVIAIQNVRLFTELSEALEQQTATAEILDGNLAVADRRAAGADAVARAAMQFCGANDAMVVLRDGDEQVIARARRPASRRLVGARRPLDAPYRAGPRNDRRANVQSRTFDLQSDE